jgi:hypothetical protein
MVGFGTRPGKQIFVDPMTRERIDAETIPDQYGRPMVDATGKQMLKERDHWFTVQFKLLWKTGAPKAGGSGTAQASTTPGM